MSAGGASDSAVIDSRYKPARQRKTLGGLILRYAPFFSCEAAFSYPKGRRAAGVPIFSREAASLRVRLI